MKVIGFSGKKQSGKTTSVKDLLERLKDRDVLELPIAQELKDVVSMLFIDDIEPEHRRGDWDKDEFKNKIHPCGKTYRQILQIFGTDMARNLWEDIWVAKWKILTKAVCPRCGVILVPDVRFANEVRAIQDLGGHVIRFTRAPFASKDQHESETALDEMEAATIAFSNLPAAGLLFDAIIDNSQMSISEQCEAVWKLVNERGWI